jgi:hypothetical protein
LREAKRQLEAELDAKRAELDDWRQAKADYVAQTGRKIYGPPKPRPVPDAPTRRINLSDPDSRPVKTASGFLQGYTAQAVATKEQFVIAADVRIGANERSDLGPLIGDACNQLAAAGIDEQPGLVLADAGYWNGPHINALAARGIPGAGPARRRHPPGSQPATPRRPLRVHAQHPQPRRRSHALQTTPSDHRARLRPDQDHPPRRPLPAKGPSRLQGRMAADHRHPQPPQALAHRPRHCLSLDPPF